MKKMRELCYLSMRMNLAKKPLHPKEYLFSSLSNRSISIIQVFYYKYVPVKPTHKSIDPLHTII